MTTPAMPAAGRSPGTALILTLLLPGLGQMYNGQAVRGLSVYLAAVFGSLAFLSFFVFVGPGHLVLLFPPVFLLFWILVALDAFRTAKRRSGAFVPRRYNRPVFYAAAWILGGLVIAPVATEATKSLLFEAYRIPSAGMDVTLRVGDYLYATKPGYGARLPFTNTPVSPYRRPNRGDVLIFGLPGNPDRNAIKRVIALPGETVEIRDRVVFINRANLIENYVHFFDSRVQSRDVIDPNIVPPGAGNMHNYGPVTVPEGHVFVLGDNRDNSEDSRYWGFLDLALVKGRARTIYWSVDAGREKIRWERLGWKVR